MAEMLDCMVNYFNFNEDAADMPRRYFSYLVVAGPGPTEDAGVATITLLAVHSPDERCDTCQHFHVVSAGGPPAALARALRYLDAYHESDRLRKVQSQVRCTQCE